jgi:hypothetical protein
LTYERDINPEDLMKVTRLSISEKRAEQRKAELKDEEPGRWIVRGAAEDQQEEDLQQVKAGALAAIGSPNWASGPPKPGKKIPETPGVLTTNSKKPRRSGD